jgi:Uma2 family endonuclease
MYPFIMDTVIEASKPPGAPRSPIQLPAVPPLEPGAHLSASEFLRRFDAMPELKKAELIDGIVHMESAVSVDHGIADQLLQGWLGHYKSRTTFLSSISNVTVRFDGKNVAQPDLTLRIPEQLGGKSKVGEDRYIHGAPEFVAEIAATSASNDLHAKLKLYQRSGVAEYLVWRSLDSQIHWFALEKDEFQEIKADPDSVIRSRKFPGLWLNVPALLNFDFAKVFETVDAGCQAPEHAEFIEKFKTAK